MKLHSQKYELIHYVNSIFIPTFINEYCIAISSYGGLPMTVPPLHTRVPIVLRTALRTSVALRPRKPRGDEIAVSDRRARPLIEHQPDAKRTNAQR